MTAAALAVLALCLGAEPGPLPGADAQEPRAPDLAAPAPGPVPADAPTVAGPPPPARPVPVLKRVAAGAVLVAGASAIVAGVLAIHARRDLTALQTASADAPLPYAAAREAATSGEVKQGVSIGLAALAGAGLVTAIACWAALPRDPPVQVGAAVGPSGATLVLAGPLP